MPHDIFNKRGVVKLHERPTPVFSELSFDLKEFVMPPTVERIFLGAALKKHPFHITKRDRLAAGDQRPFQHLH